MLIKPANTCGSIAGLFVFRRISRQRARITELPSRTNSSNRKTISIVPPVDAGTARASKLFRYNEEIAMLEIYSQLCREEALIVTAIVDDEEVEVLIFKGFSSCLSGETAVDPARSVLPERAVITKIDRVRDPFDP